MKTIEEIEEMANQYARDYCFDNHDGFVSNNYSWSEMWLSKHGIDEEKEK